MLAQELITDSIPPLKLSDTGIKALSWMDEFKVSHLPVIEGNKYLGLISDTDILDMNSADEFLESQKRAFSKAHVKNSQHIYDVLKIISDLKLSLIPVIDDNEIFIGIIPAPHLVQKFAQMAAMNDPGSILVLELNVNDYSLSHISQIVESNDARILSSYVTSTSDSTQMELTLKINKPELTRIIATFERFNYIVKASYHRDEYVDDLKDRYDSFMNYLNI